MSCNCHKFKALGILEHVRILAQQMANIENKSYIIHACGSAYNFKPLLNNTEVVIEVINPQITKHEITTVKKPLAKKA
jgi:hypothetical protein